MYGGDDTIRFISDKSENIYLRFASATKYGLGAVLGNDCSEVHRSIITASNKELLFDLHVQGMKIGQWGVIGIEGAIRHKENVSDEYWVNNSGHIVYDDEWVEDHLMQKCAEINVPFNRLIIVSHTPPYGKLDTGLRFGVEHLGSPALLRFIEENQPALVLSGHCHSAGGKMKKVGNTLIVNSASDDLNIQKTRMAIIELSGQGDPIVEWIDPNPHTVLSLPYIGEEGERKDFRRADYTSLKEMSS